MLLVERKKVNKNKMSKGKFMNFFSGISGGLSFFGGWQVCHNLCFGIVAALSLIGITIVGMPLLFLTQYAVYFWSAAVLLLIPTLVMYWENRKHMSKNLILANIGIVIVAVPFADLQSYRVIFWVIGGMFILTSVILFLRRKLNLE